MAENIATAVPLLEILRRQAPDGHLAHITEINKKLTPFVANGLFLQSNMPDGHKGTIRTGYTEPSWRILNYGVPQTYSQTASVKETFGSLEDFNDIDEKVLEIYVKEGRPGYRFSEDSAHLEGFLRKLETFGFYGLKSQYPDAFNGLIYRYSASSTDEDTIGYQVIKSTGASTDNMSAWLIAQGEHKIHWIYPQNGVAGFRTKDLGLISKTDANNRIMNVWRTQFDWDAGLFVEDWKYAVRLANISVAALVGQTPPNLIDEFSKMIDRHKDPGSATFYVTKEVRAALRNQIRDKTNIHLTLESITGKQPQLHFDGIPIEVSSMLIKNETAVL